MSDHPVHRAEERLGSDFTPTTTGPAGFRSQQRFTDPTAGPEAAAPHFGTIEDAGSPTHNPEGAEPKGTQEEDRGE